MMDTLERIVQLKDVQVHALIMDTATMKLVSVRQDMLVPIVLVQLVQMTVPNAGSVSISSVNVIQDSLVLIVLY
jgi:hypothetical protein